MTRRFALARYLDDGSLDQSFSRTGKVLADFDVAPDEEIAAIAIDRQERIVACGRAWGGDLSHHELQSYFALARFRPDGSADTDFDVNGNSLTAVGDSHFASAAALVIDEQERIVVGGTARANGRDRFAIVRYLPGGELDGSFGQRGIVLGDFEANLDESIEALALDRSGRIVAAGWAMLAEGTHFALARYLPDGRLDQRFGDGGLVYTDFADSSAEGIESVVFDSQDRLIAGGWATVDGNTCIALARYTATGALDPSFGANGRVLVSFSSSNDEMLKALAIDAEERIVVGGLATVNEGTRFALARFCSDGTIDESFNREGHVLTDFDCSPMEGIRAIAVDRKGRIVAGGEAEQQFALARYLPDGGLDSSFGADGKTVTGFHGAGYESVWSLVIDRQDRIVVGGSAE